MEESVKPDPKKWIERYADMLYQYALPRVKDSSTAEDLVQETFLAALKGLENFRADASEKNWLFAILKHKIIDHYRTKNIDASNTLGYTETDEWFTVEGIWKTDKRPNKWNITNDPMDKKEIQKIIDLCKKKLKELQQKVFTLKYLEDLDSDEICKVLNISTTNYWVLIHRARLQMRECVEKNWLKS